MQWLQWCSQSFCYSGWTYFLPLSTSKWNKKMLPTKKRRKQQVLPTPNKNYTVALYGPPPLLFSSMVLYWVSNTLECWPGGVVFQSHSRLRFFCHFDTGPQLDTTWNILHMFLFPPLPNILPDNSNLFKFADTFTTTGLWHPITPTQERQANASITCCAAILNIQTCYLCIQVAKRDGNESTLKKTTAMT